VSEADRVKWDERWRDRAGDGTAGPEPFLVREVLRLPRGRVLDVASGDGRNTLWLAGQGFAVTAVDVSPVAIDRLGRAAPAQGLTVAARAADLDAPGALADFEPFDGLVVVRFKPSPAHWAALLDVLRPGGRVLLCSFGRGQHERHGFPLAFCLDRAELAAELELQLRLLDWRSFEEGGACLEGSTWEKQPGS
jgi:SAM-dependent methyltransferase